MARIVKRKVVNAYFSSASIWIVVFGGLVFLISLPSSIYLRKFLEKPEVFIDEGLIALSGVFLYVFSVLVSFLLIGFGLYKLRLGRPKDSAIDATLASDLAKLNEVVYKKLSVAKEELVEDTITLVGVPAQVELMAKKGKDGVARFSSVAVAKFNFSKKQLFVYSAVIDLVTGYIVAEEAAEIDYSEIDSVMTQNMPQSFWFKGIMKSKRVECPDAETFVLKRKGGTTYQVPLRSQKLSKATHGAQIPVTAAHEAIRTLRNTLRDIRYRRTKWQRDERRRPANSPND